jgi:hypothetical protein
VNEVVIDIMAAINEDESRRISARTRSAMAEAKRRGRSFGTPANLSPNAARLGRELGARAARERAVTAYKHVAPLIVELNASGKSLGQIAADLNGRGLVTRRDRSWTKVQVARVLRRSRVGSAYGAVAFNGTKDRTTMTPDDSAKADDGKTATQRYAAWHVRNCNCITAEGETARDANSDTHACETRRDNQEQMA